MTAQRYKLGIDELSYYHLMEASNRARALVKLCAVEVLLFGPMLAFAVLASRRRRAGMIPGT